VVLAPALDAMAAPTLRWRPQGVWCREHARSCCCCYGGSLLLLLLLGTGLQHPPLLLPGVTQPLA